MRANQGTKTILHVAPILQQQPGGSVITDEITISKGVWMKAVQLYKKFRRNPPGYRSNISLAKAREAFELGVAGHIRGKLTLQVTM